MVRIRKGIASRYWEDLVGTMCIELSGVRYLRTKALLR